MGQKYRVGFSVLRLGDLPGWIFLYRIGWVCCEAKTFSRIDPPFRGRHFYKDTSEMARKRPHHLRIMQQDQCSRINQSLPFWTMLWSENVQQAQPALSEVLDRFFCT